MSQLMSKLNSLSESRKVGEGVLIEETQEDQEDQEDQEQIHVVSEYKGIYFLSFLIILLIGFSVLSVSISLKTFTQLEATWADSKAMLETLNRQKNDIAAIQSLITNRASEEFAQVEGLKSQINELKASIKNREGEFSEMKIAYSDWKKSTQELIDELQLSDKLMSKKYIYLNDQFEKFREENFFISNTY